MNYPSLADKTFVMPANSCNSHLHIIDPAFPNDGKAAEQIGTIEMYRDIACKLHLPRAVFVNAKPFGTDNRIVLDAIRRFGTEHARGIAVCHETVSDTELKRLHEGGIRGLRFSVWNPANAIVSFKECLPLGERIRDMGWNVQLHMSAAQLAAQAEVIEKLPCRVVIDHMGRLDPHSGTEDPAFRIICKWIDKGNTWVKLSGPYLNTASGAPWEDAAKTARSFAEYAPERVVWGSDYPHTTEKNKPDEEVLTALIPEWLTTEHARELALVKNPEELYGFQ